MPHLEQVVDGVWRAIDDTQHPARATRSPGFIKATEILTTAPWEGHAVREVPDDQGKVCRIEMPDGFLTETFHIPPPPLHS